MLAAVVGCAAPTPQVVEKEVVVERPVVETVVVEREVAAYAPSPPGIPSEAADLGLEPVEERMIIWTGDVSLIVKDAEESLEEVEAIAKDLGGYVVNSSSWYQEEQLRARLTIRVPAEDFDAAMARLKDLAIKVENRNISTQDVTEEYTDLDARLRNLEATEKELLELLTEVRERTSKAEDVLAVHRELTSIRSQIEQLKGRMQYLEKMTAMATINVELIPDVLAKPIVVAGWRPTGTAANALRTLVKTLQFIVDAAIWIIIYVLPTLVVIAIPFLILWLIWRRWRRGRKAA
jgi:hypothetical protein